MCQEFTLLSIITNFKRKRNTCAQDACHSLLGFCICWQNLVSLWLGLSLNFFLKENFISIFAIHSYYIHLGELVCVYNTSYSVLLFLFLYSLFGRFFESHILVTEVLLLASRGFSQLHAMWPLHVSFYSIADQEHTRIFVTF